MKKSITTFLLALMASTFAIAQEQVEFKWQEKKQFGINLNDTRQLMELKRNMPALKRKEVKSNDGATYKWKDRIESMPKYMNEFYDTYVEAKNEVLAGKKNWLSDPSLTPSGYDDGYAYPILREQSPMPFSFTPGASDEEIQYAAYLVAEEYVQKFIDEVNSYMFYLYLCLDYDNPDCFWTSNSYYWSYKWGFGMSYYKNRGDGTVSPTLYVDYTLQNSEYDYRMPDFRTASDISKAVSTYNSTVSNMTAQTQGMSRYDQLDYLDTWLTKNNYYNPCYIDYGYDPPMAHSAYSALACLDEEFAPVCEGYARAFKIFCDKLDIPCTVVTGWAGSSPYTASEPHMWNLVQMEDGQWYAVDTTWDDPTSSATLRDKNSGLENKNWFMVSLAERPDGFYPFTDTHRADEEWSLGYGEAEGLGVMAMPEISTTTYDPDYLDAILSTTDNDHPTVSIFNLQGHRLQKMQKGVNIVGGKKLMVK